MCKLKIRFSFEMSHSKKTSFNSTLRIEQLGYSKSRAVTTKLSDFNSTCLYFCLH